tara:strand:+ start:761 stop:1078 length:318 start_codon:yes stop_codon:yes gene_type:complete
MNNNQKIVQLIEKRLTQGAKEHGAEVPFDDTRDHLQDALEEALDMAVYLAAKIIEIKRRESKWLRLKRKCIMTFSKIGPKSMKRKCKLWTNSLITYWEATKNRMK